MTDTLTFLSSFRSDDPQRDAEAISAAFRKHEGDLAALAYRRADPPKYRFWDRHEGRVLARGPALGERAVRVGYTSTLVLVRIQVPHFTETRQVRSPLNHAWRVVDTTDESRQHEYGDAVLRLICESAHITPDALQTETLLA